MSTTFEQLSAILIKEYKVTPDQLTLDAQLQDLGIDSLGVVELLWHIEDAFLIDQLVTEQGVQMLPELSNT